MSTPSAQNDYENKIVYLLEEIISKSENEENNTSALSHKMKNKLYKDKHIGGIDITVALPVCNDPQQMKMK